ncbi:MAG: type II CRISPR-associated endonuclease Cas1 [Acholeplasmataceae bacterium]|nr:type II CRISPR-associated endonuclease Cas1 [Acholeplasmataceae bacterium]
MRTENNWLYVESPKGTSRIPVEDIYSIVIDNQRSSISVAAMTALTDAGVHVLLCNDKHLPVTVIYPHNTHYRPYNILKKQFAMPQIEKDFYWQRVIRGKLLNQANVMAFSGGPVDVTKRLRELAKEVEPGDPGNREGIGAKMFFRGLYGTTFLRFSDDAVNAALNYGYAILRSAVTKTLYAYGFQTVLGIHHISETNPFNLAEDMIEPLRPLVDYWVVVNSESLVENLTAQNRMELINIVNQPMLWEGKKMHVRTAIDKYIGSFTSAVDKQDPSLLKFPLIIELPPYPISYEDD